jgi:hypothetical protein
VDIQQIGSHPPFREGYFEHYFSSASAVELAAIDASLLALIGIDDRVRRRWIERAPQYLREAHSGGRWIWLSDEERELMPIVGS